VRAVVSVAAFSSWKAIAGRYLGPFGRALTARGVDAEHCAARLGSRPLLLVHADGDRVVPPAHAEAIHISAIEAGVPCELLSPRASGHTIVATRKVIQRAIAEFFDTAFATEMDTTPAAARMGEYE
jgi:predicted esterase